MEHKNELGGKNVSIPECVGKPFVSIPECVGKPFQYDYDGNFRIVVKGHASKWTSPDDIATLTIEGEWTGNDEIRSKEIYIGVSGINDGDLPKECPLLVTVVDGDGDANFVHVKIVDLEADNILDEDDVDEQLYDSIYSDDMGVIVKASSIKDYVKVRITEFGSNVDEGRILSKEDVENYLIRTFSSDKFDVLDVNGNKIN